HASRVSNQLTAAGRVRRCSGYMAQCPPAKHAIDENKLKIAETLRNSNPSILQKIFFGMIRFCRLLDMELEGQNFLFQPIPNLRATQPFRRNVAWQNVIP
ncbi:MAG: hypothetical protein OIF58_11945, partial [Cohaesibacter sp.]|nr:hypothetical protein [Cohaesibacter sp.]